MNKKAGACPKSATSEAFYIPGETPGPPGGGPRGGKGAAKKTRSFRKVNQNLNDLYKGCYADHSIVELTMSTNGRYHRLSMNGFLPPLGEPTGGGGLGGGPLGGGPRGVPPGVPLS